MLLENSIFQKDFKERKRRQPFQVQTGDFLSCRCKGRGTQDSRYFSLNNKSYEMRGSEMKFQPVWSGDGGDVDDLIFDGEDTQESER